MKFTNLTADELQNLNNNLSNILEKYSNELDKLKYVDENIVAGRHYLVRFKNPFLDIHRFASGKDINYHTDNAIQFNDSEAEIITCIGISDNFGQIHLQNVWDNTVTMFYKKSEAKEFINDFGNKEHYITKQGFFLNRKNITYFKVKYSKGERKYDSFYYVDNKETTGAYNVFLDDVSFVISAEEFNREIKNIKTKLNHKDAEKYWNEYCNYSYSKQDEFNLKDFTEITNDIIIKDKTKAYKAGYLTYYLDTINPNYINDIYDKKWLYIEKYFNDDDYADFKKTTKYEYLVNFKNKTYITLYNDIRNILHDTIIDEYMKRND